MARPPLYPRQVVIMVPDTIGDRIDLDAGKRPDQSKSAAARRLLELGIMLADAIENGPLRDDGILLLDYHEARLVQ